jgi:glycosyltransferase involved in cell wall biosynthesis
MANEWTKAGHQTDFLAAKAGWPQIRELAPGARLISSDGLFNATRHLHRSWVNFPPFAYRMGTAHWVGFPLQYDIVYATTQLIVEVYAAMVAARRQRARLVVKVHHVLAAQPARTGFFDRLFLWSERRTMRWINQKAGLIMCGTNLVAEDFHRLEQALGLPRRETVQVGYGIDLEAFPCRENEPKTFDLAALGRMHEHKGVFDLAPVWKEVLASRPNARLLVIGEGPHRPRTEQMFKEAGLWSSVTFTGGISEEEKNRLLCQSRLGLTLSYEEGWGLSINEFLGAGLPVIGYELPIYHQVFPGRLELVKPGDKAEAARKILALLEDQPRQRELGRGGRKFVERYDYRKVAQEEFKVLQQLVGTSGV